MKLLLDQREKYYLLVLIFSDFSKIRWELLKKKDQFFQVAIYFNLGHSQTLVSV